MITVNVVGNLGKENTIRQTQNGNNFCHNSIAVRTDQKDQNGEYKTDWYNISIWGNRGDTFAQCTQKGSKVFISGTLSQRFYQKDDGSQGISMDIRVQDFEFISFPQNQGQQGGFGQQGANQASPFNNQNNQQASPFSNQAFNNPPLQMPTNNNNQGQANNFVGQQGQQQPQFSQPNNNEIDIQDDQLPF